MRKLLALLVAAAIIFGGPQPAHAAEVVWVDASSTSLSAQWRGPLWDAIRYIDGATGSDMVVGRCRAGARCIVVTESWVVGRAAGWADPVYPGRWSIVFNPGWRGHSLAVRRWVASHELGHAHGLDHTNTCTNLMYRYTACNGRVPPFTLLAWQRRVLVRH